MSKKPCRPSVKFDVLVMPLETPLETIYTAAKIASHRGAKVLLNPAPAQVLTKDLLELVDVLLPNEYEIALMTGHAAASLQLMSASAAEKLLSPRSKKSDRDDGESGRNAFRWKKWNRIIPACPVQAVDTTAAGDCFVGALAVGLCEGKSYWPPPNLPARQRLISVTREGAQPSLPHREEVVQFMLKGDKSK